MKRRDPGFWLELSGKVGPPIFAGALVASLVSGRFELVHGRLVTTPSPEGNGFSEHAK